MVSWQMGDSWLILADDLTGAADCGASFAARGLECAVGWGEVPGGFTTQCYSFAAGTRAGPESEASRVHALAIRRLAREGLSVFKKIDSTLRGHPAAEIAAVASALGTSGRPAFAVLAPAFPAQERTTLGGRVLVRGLPLQNSGVWRDAQGCPGSDLAGILGVLGVRSSVVALETVRSGEASLRQAFSALEAGGTDVAVCDALEDSDLESIVRARPFPSRGFFFSGSAGLALAISRSLSPRSRPPISFPGSKAGTLLVVGSAAQASRDSAHHLAASGAVLHLCLEPEEILGKGGPAAKDRITKSVAQRLDLGEDVLVEIRMNHRFDPALGGKLARGLAGVLAPAVSRAGALVLTGGETAEAVLSGCAIREIRLSGEVAPGIPAGVTSGPAEIPVVTKAGAFGSRETLGLCVSYLRDARRSGFLP